MKDENFLTGIIATLVIIVWILTGLAMHSEGSKEGLREQDSRVITELRQNNKILTQLVNYAIKQDTTGTVRKVVEANLKTK